MTPTEQETGMEVELMAENILQKRGMGYIMGEPSTQETSSSLIEFLSRSWSATSMRAFRRICNSLDRGLQWSLIDQEVMNANYGRKLWVDFMNDCTMMKWIRKKLLPKEKKKEELNLKAAMSVAVVAAAVAAMSIKSATTGHEEDDMRKLAVATAATLVAAQCAEAAERMGAQQANVASFIRSAVATVGPNDLVVLTAAAATTLRGRKAYHRRKELPALTCPSREFGFLHDKEIISRGVELPTCINNGECIPPLRFNYCNFIKNLGFTHCSLSKKLFSESGKTQLKILHVYAKDRQVCLKVQTKHLGGTFTTSRNYTIREAKESECKSGPCVTNEVNGFCFICIQTEEEAEIHISFKEYEQCKLWSSTISQLLLLQK